MPPISPTNTHTLPYPVGRELLIEAKAACDRVLHTPCAENLRTAFTRLAAYRVERGNDEIAKQYVEDRCDALVELAFEHNLLTNAATPESFEFSVVGYALGCSNLDDAQSHVIATLSRTAKARHDPIARNAAIAAVKTALQKDVREFGAEGTEVVFCDTPGAPPRYAADRNIAVLWDGNAPALLVRNNDTGIWSYKSFDGLEACAQVWHRAGLYPVDIDDDVMARVAEGSEEYISKPVFVFYASLSNAAPARSENVSESALIGRI